MKIAGLQKTSLLDYPDKISAIVWTQGCNFRCPFCYNKHIVLGTTTLIPPKDVLSLLQKRIGMLDAVVISGGEPFLQDDLLAFIEKVKDLGYLVKIDTNGSYPDKLKEVFDKNLVDYVAMDVKAPKEKYPTLAGTSVDIKKIEQSITLIQSRAPAYEFKTTLVPELLTETDIVHIAEWLDGSHHYYLQQFKINTPLLSSACEKRQPYAKEYLEAIIKKIQPHFLHCSHRGL